MGGSKLKIVAGGVVLVASWIAILMHYWVRPPFDSRQPEAIGQVAAEEALKLVGPGGKVSVILRDTATARSPSMDAVLRSFAGTLSARKVALSSTNSMKVDPLRVPAVPPGDFLQLIKRGGEGDVIVSFLGPPALTDAQITKLDAKGPKIVALCAGAIPRVVDLKSLFQRGLLSAAIVNRSSVAAVAPGDTPRAAFDRQYQVITPATAGDWADARTAK